MTNAAGGVNETFKPGTFMMITDHILYGVPNPLIGQNLQELGERFPDVSEIYTKDLREVIRRSADSVVLRFERERICSLPDHPMRLRQK